MQYQENITIEGETYTITMLTPSKSLKLLTRLVKLIGEPISLMAGGLGANAETILPKAVKALAEKMDESEVDSLVKELLGSVLLKNVPMNGPVFETHFQGRIGHLFKLLGKVMRFQYGDFLTVLADAQGGAAGSP